MLGSSHLKLAVMDRMLAELPIFLRFISTVKVSCFLTASRCSAVADSCRMGPPVRLMFWHAQNGKP